MNATDRWRAVRDAYERPVSETESMPMFMSSEPTPEYLRMSRQNRVVLMFMSVVLLGFTWMPAVLIADPQPNFYWRAAMLFGWPKTLAASFLLAGLPMVLFLFVQYHDPRGLLRKCTSRWAQVGMLLASAGWIIMASRSWVLDAPLFTTVLLWHAAISIAFAWVIGESLNNELILEQRGTT